MCLWYRVTAKYELDRPEYRKEQILYVHAIRNMKIKKNRTKKTESKQTDLELFFHFYVEDYVGCGCSDTRSILTSMYSDNLWNPYFKASLQP